MLATFLALRRRARHPLAGPWQVPPVGRLHDSAALTGSARVRIAPSKMLPSEEAHAICDVTLDGPRAGGGVHDEPPREGGVPAGRPRALPPGDPSGERADPR